MMFQWMIPPPLVMVESWKWAGLQSMSVSSTLYWSLPIEKNPTHSPALTSMRQTLIVSGPSPATLVLVHPRRTHRPKWQHPPEEDDARPADDAALPALAEEITDI